MKRRCSRWRDAAYLLMLAVVFVLVVVWWRDLAVLWRQHALTFVGTALMMALGMVIQARNFSSFLDVRANLSLARMSGVWGGSALLNYAGPFQPGVLARIVFLRAHGVDAVAGVLATWRQLCASLWLALAGLAIGLLAMGDARAHWPAATLLAVFAGLFVLWRWRERFLPVVLRTLRLQRHQELLMRALAGMPPLAMLGVGTQYLVGMLVLLWVYPRFGADMGIGEALVLTCVVYVSALVAVLPGNVGVLEAIYALGGHELGLGLKEAAALALLLRVAHIGACLVLLPLARGVRAGSG